MKTCSYCGDVIKFVGQPVELKIYDYYKDGVNQRFVNFCNDKCTMKMVTDHIEKHGSIGFLYQLVYHLTPKICDFCGTYTHAPEFCLSHGTKLEHVEKFRKNFQDGEFIGPGACIDVEGSVVRILKPRCFEIDFEIEEYSCRIGTFSTRLENIESGEFKQTRIPLACFQENIEEARFILDKNEDFIGESDSTIHFIKNWKIRRIEGSILDETLHDVAFQHVRKIEREDKMFLPLNILQKVINYPIEKFNKDEYEFTFKGGMFMEKLRDFKNGKREDGKDWEESKDGTVRL